MIKEVDKSVEENIVSKKFMTKNIQEIWDNKTRPNLIMITIKGEDSHLQGSKNIFSKNMEENCSNLKKDMPLNIQEDL